MAMQQRLQANEAPIPSRDKGSQSCCLSMIKYRVRFLALIFSVVLWKVFGDRCDLNDETCQADGIYVDEDYCRSNVLLLEGFPGNDESDLRTSSLANGSAAHFSKLSRFSKEFDSSSHTLDARILHVSANGDHEGWFVLVPKMECLHFAKLLVAREIIAALVEDVPEQVKQVDLRGPHRLVDEEGKSFPDKSSSRRLHLLLPREIFVHEAVFEGFVRTLSDGTILRTLSLSPRVFVVDPILSIEDCDELIETSSKDWRRSGETHYSDEYKDYRTSLSGHTPHNARVVQHLWRRVCDVTGVPEGGVESPQLIKYETGTSWYKAHHDYFHIFNNKPLEEVRMFVHVRAQELMRLNMTDITDVLGNDDTSLRRFDNLERPLSKVVGKRLLDSLGLINPNSFDERRLVHDFLLQSADPLREFSRASVHYASALLESNGASQPMLLAEQYFRVEEVPNVDVVDYTPYVFKPIEVNRHVTVLPILRAADRGGNTAFPLSKSSLGIEPDDDEEIAECKRGLIVKPNAGQALMFYSRLPRGDLDPSSSHAGCPPKEGEKYAVNCFTWDSDESWAWRFHQNIDELYHQYQEKS